MRDFLAHPAKRFYVFSITRFLAKQSTQKGDLIMAHILLAEDDQSMLNFLVMALKRAGHEVTSAADGLQALAALDEHDCGAFDLLLTDIVMPGMDGIELSQKAMKKCPQLKVMFITGFAAVAMGQHNRQSHDAKILSKPFHLNDLVNQVEKLLKAA